MLPAHGTYVDPRGGKTRFADYARVWQASRVHRPTTEVHVETTLRIHILPAFGLTRDAVDAVLRDVPRPSRGPTVRRHLKRQGLRRVGGESACTPDSVTEP